MLKKSILKPLFTVYRFFLNVNFGVDPPPLFWKKFTFRIYFFLHPSLKVIKVICCFTVGYIQGETKRPLESIPLHRHFKCHKICTSVFSNLNYYLHKNAQNTFRVQASCTFCKSQTILLHFATLYYSDLGKGSKKKRQIIHIVWISVLHPLPLIHIGRC